MRLRSKINKALGVDAIARGLALKSSRVSSALVFTPEQFANGTAAVGVDNGPAIRQAMAAAEAVGGMVQLGPYAYESWQPIRTTDVAYSYQVADGIAFYFTKNFKMVGVAGKSKIRFLNSNGTSNDTVTQNPSGGPWRGYGLVLNPPGTIDYCIVEDVIFDGTKTYYNPTPGTPTNAQSDITHKAISTNPVTGDILFTRLKNVSCINWGGEEYYIGGSAATTFETYNCEGAYSNQSAWNPTGLGKGIVYNPNMHDCYLASEEISGAGRQHIKGRYANCYNCGSIGTQFFVGGQSYSVPNRDLTVAPKFVEYVDTLFENVGTVSLGSWSRGTIKSIDSAFTCGATGRDVFIDIDNVTDQGTATSILILSGPPDLTTYIGGYTSGPYQTPLANSRFKVRNVRTARAKANSVTNVSAVSILSGLIDANSVSVEVSGELGYTMYTVGTPVAGQTFPKIIVGEVTPLINVSAGGSDSPSTATNYTPDRNAMDLQPTAVGPVNLGMANSYAGAPYIAADGQEYTHRHNGTSGNIARFAANGPMLALSQDRYLVNSSDKLVLRYNAVLSKWQDKLYVTSAQMKTSPVVVNAATYTVVHTDGVIRITTTNCTITLPSAALYPGRLLVVSNLTANSLVSAASNVCPLGSATPGTAILAATAGKFANLRSDGTNWLIEGAN